METVDISAWGLAAAFVLVVPTLIIDSRYQLKLRRETVVSIGRMSLQLLVVGVFLEYVFTLNNWILNLAWFSLMVGTAVFSSLSKAKVNLKKLVGPLSLSFAIPTLLTLIYFNALIIRLDYLFEARYLIALGGMILGNVLSTNVVALNSFYQSLHTQEKYYLYRLGLGATRTEALAPFFRRSVQLALSPALAKTATIGIVSLPGMMSGQIIGGSTPNTAIKYQIAIMIAIYTASMFSVLLSLILSIGQRFDGYGVLRKAVK
jgi:putative ABC transport system permease protein